MSPELAILLKDDDMALALKRMHTYQRLRELGAPLMIIQNASDLLSQSKAKLGDKLNRIPATIYLEYREIEDAAEKQIDGEE